MNKLLFYKYIDKLTTNDIYRIASNNDINLSEKEVNNVYNYIKNNYDKYIKGIIRIEDAIEDAKEILSKDNYDKAYQIYLKYKENN